MVLGTEKLLTSLVLMLALSGPAAVEAAGSGWSITWPSYVDPNNGTFKPENYDMVGMCSVDDGTFAEVGRASPPASPLPIGLTVEPGSTLRCFLYAYNKVGKVPSDNGPIVEAVVPFVKPATPGAPELVFTP